MEEKVGDVEGSEKKKAEYFQTEKLSWKDYKTTLPFELRPTKKTSYILGTIFVIVIIIGILSMPFGSLLAGKTDVQLKIGLPWTFFELSLEDPGKMPIKLANLIWDFILYIILAYAIDVSINVFMGRSFLREMGKTKKEKEAMPKLHKLPGVKPEVKENKVKEKSLP